MSSKFVRNITETKLRGDVYSETEPLSTNVQNDLLSDEKDVFVRNRNEYHALTDNIKTIKTDGNSLTIENKNDENETIVNVNLATKADAESGTNNNKLMTPLQTKNAIEALTEPYVDKRTKGYFIPEIFVHYDGIRDGKTVSFACYREHWAEWHGEGDLPIHIPYWKKNEDTQTLELDYITKNASSFVDNKYIYVDETNDPFDSLYESYYEYSGFTGNPVYTQKQVEGSFLYEKYVYNTYVVFGGANDTRTLQPVQLVVTIDSIVDEGGGSVG